MKWVTRERPKIDRIACPWLIERFIDRDPEFVFRTKCSTLRRKPVRSPMTFRASSCHTWEESKPGSTGGNFSVGYPGEDAYPREAGGTARLSITRTLSPTRRSDTSSCSYRA